MTDSHAAPESQQPRPSDPAPTDESPRAGRDSGASRVVKLSNPRGRAVGWRSRDIVRATALVVVVLLGVRLFWIAHVLFFVVFLGMLFAVAVSAGVDKLQRFRIPRALGATMIVVTFVALLVGVGAWLAPTLRDQGTELRQKLPEAVDRVQDWVKQRQSGVLGLLVVETAGGSGPVTGAKGDTLVRPPRVRAPGDSVVEGKPATLHDQLSESMSGMSRYLFPFITSTVEIVGGVLLILFLSIYFAAEPGLYRRGLLSLLPARKRARGTIMMDRVAVVLRKWLITQLIAMAVMWVVSTIVLLLLHVKAAFALGVLVGLFEFIPNIGPILAALPAVAMGFLDSPEKAGYVAVAYWGMQFVENHLLIPLLMKSGLRLPPALTVITQAVFAIVFGFIGLMVAVPMLATIVVMVEMFYLEQLPLEGTWSHATPGADEPHSRIATARPQP